MGPMDALPPPLAALLSSLPQPDPRWFVRPSGEDASRTIHGVSHTLRVMVHVSEIALALRVSEWERDTAVLAALWHDIGRTHDGGDYYHGAKSAGKVVGLGLHAGWPADRVEVALHAVTHHSGDDAHAERAASWFADPEAAHRVFRILKDADGLDRVRLGDLDVSYLRFPENRSRVERARELLRLVP
jgi:HD superfamily phosphodiesterase